MKTFLFISVATLALFHGEWAHAQNYETQQAKGGDNLINDTRRMEPSPEAPAQTEPEAGTPQETSDYSTGSPYDDFTGPYVGAEVGAAFEDDVEGLNGGFFAGYGYEHNLGDTAMYAGLEIGYEMSNADEDIGGIGYQKNDAWLFTFRPGMSVNENMLGYGIVGYSLAEFESGGDDENLDGMIFGLGGEFNTHTAFKARLEYAYTDYEDKDIGDIHFDGHENSIKLGGVFQF